MPSWGWWLVIGGLLAALEVATVTLVFGMFSIACLVGLLAEGLGANITAQILIAIAASLPLLLVQRPIVQRYLYRRSPALISGTAGYVGRPAKVTLAIAPKQPGQVSLHGELWPAISTAEIEIGATVQIAAIEGPNLVVTPTT